MFHRILVSCALAMSILIPAIADDDDADGGCHKILSEGLKNYTQISTDSNYREIASQLLQNDQSSSSSNSGGASFNIPYNGMNIGGSGNFANADEMKKYFLSDNKKNLTQSDAVSIISSVLAPDVAEKWGECMNNWAASRPGKLITGEIVDNDGQITITVRYAMNLGTDSLPIISSTYLLGAIPGGSFPKEGSALSNDKTILCQRIGKGPVTFVINTSRGSWVGRLHRADEPVIPVQKQDNTYHFTDGTPDIGDEKGLQKLKDDWADELRNKGAPEAFIPHNLKEMELRVRARWAWRTAINDCHDFKPGAQERFDVFIHSNQYRLQETDLKFYEPQPDEPH